MFDVNDDRFSVPAPLALLEEMVVTRLTKDAEEREYCTCTTIPATKTSGQFSFGWK